MRELLSLTMNALIIALFYSAGMRSLKLCQVTRKQQVLLSLVNFFVAEVLLFFKLDYLGLPILFLSSSIYLIFIGGEKGSVVVSGIVAIIATLTADILFGYTVVSVLNLEKSLFSQGSFASFLGLFFVYGSAFLICTVMGFVLQLTFKEKLQLLLRKKSVTLFLGNLMTALAILYFNAMYYRYINNSETVLKVNTVLFSVYFLSTLVMTWRYFKIHSREIEYYNKMKEFEQMMNYVDVLEEICSDNRKFKHDYMNVVYSIYGYIEEGNIEKLNQYFEKKILPMSSKEFEGARLIAPLTNLKVTELKGLLNTKMLLAKSRKIDLRVEVLESIEAVNMDIVDLCRLLGILIDNAVEEVEGMALGSVQIAFIKNKHSKSIVVQNSCKEEISNIAQLFKKGYSSKGENRGLGLFIVKEIVDKNKKATLNTSFTNGHLVQELILAD